MHTEPHPASGLPAPRSRATSAASLRETQAVADLFLAILRRDLLGFYPGSQVVRDDDDGSTQTDWRGGPDFQLSRAEDGEVLVSLFGVRYRLQFREGHRFVDQDRRMVEAIGAVLSLRYQHLFQINHSARLELYRGGSEDHYVAAFVEPEAYRSNATRPSRIAATIHTLRTAALSTYENRRVSTGVLLLGPEGDPGRPTPLDALPYGVELTALKSIHRLCDGKRTLFQVDGAGRLAHIIDIAGRAQELVVEPSLGPPCARDYVLHARATATGGHVCLVLSPNQEIKLFAEGVQAFAFAHGRWRILDPAHKFAVWAGSIADPNLARILFQTALDLSECRQGGLFVVVEDPDGIQSRLVARHDLLDDDDPDPSDAVAGEPPTKRALHYLARGKNVVTLDRSILEALAAIDGAIVVDQTGQLLAFGAILRLDTSANPGPVVEGARTTAAMIASRFGPVLKVSEDGVISCFLDGVRVWDL